MERKPPRKGFRKRIARVWTRFLVRFFPQKALADLFPDLANRIHLLSNFPSLLQNAASDNAEKPYETHQSSTWVFRAVKVWQDLMAGLPIQVVNKNGKRVNHEIIDRLLSFPNPDMSAYELWSRWALEIATRGEAPFEVVFKDRQPAEFWPHNPDHVQVRVEKSSKIYARVESYRIYQTSVADYELEKEEMIHWKFFNPKNPYRGLSPLHALRHATLNDQLAVAWQFYFFKNQARPDYALVVPGGLTPDERESYERSLAERFGLTASDFGVGRPLILEEGITDIKTFSHPPKDLEWINQRKMTRDEIGGVFGVPRELMFADVAKYENLDQAELLTWTLTILPLLKFRDDRLTHYFRMLDLLTPDQALMTDLSRVWALRRRLKEVFDQSMAFYRMGVPFYLINEYFGFGIERFPSDDISNPIGTVHSFDTGESGEVVTEAEETPSQVVDEEAAEADKFFKERTNGRNY
jgi:HK97 family phage portal protein